MKKSMEELVVETREKSKEALKKEVQKFIVSRILYEMSGDDIRRIITEETERISVKLENYREKEMGEQIRFMDMMSSVIGVPTVKDNHDELVEETREELIKTFCELGATYEKMVEALEKVNNE
jgi:hypothetical protein